MNLEGSWAPRFSSGLLSDEDRILRECPRGRVLREAPWVYEIRGMHGLAYNASFEMLDLPRYTRRMLGLVASEESRLREMEKAKQDAEQERKYASRVLTG